MRQRWLVERRTLKKDEALLVPMRRQRAKGIRMNIIIADDDSVSRTLLKRTLENWRHEVAECTDGAEAWREYSKGRSRLVISNWMMPEVDGPELCRRIRAEQRPDYTYVLLLSGRVGREDFLEGMEAGADDYLTKPLDRAELNVRLKVASRILSLKAEVKRLQSILPICSWCKKIKANDNLWHDVEEYISGQIGAGFTHGICPECQHRNITSILEDLKRHPIGSKE